MKKDVESGRKGRAKDIGDKVVQEDFLTIFAFYHKALTLTQQGKDYRVVSSNKNDIQHYLEYVESTPVRKNRFSIVVGEEYDCDSGKTKYSLTLSPRQSGHD